MNVFLVHPDAHASSIMLYKADPIRARKQLLECCQLLATADHIMCGSTTMMRADGEPYGKAHTHHPCTRHMVASWDQQFLTMEVAACLAVLLPTHACAKALGNWTLPKRAPIPPKSGFVVVRFGHWPQLVKTREEYATLCREYLETHKGIEFN